MPFSQASIDFLFENRIRDSREWYNEHKDEYRRLVVEPMAELVTELTPVIRSIDDQLICDPKIGKTISRIHRDTRFSHDKSVFRATAWCVFKRDKHLCPHYPAFYFEMGPSGFSYGCGYYDAGPQLMENFRTLVLVNDPTFDQMRRFMEGQDHFVMDGARYKRSKFPDADPQLRQWLDLKNICFDHTSTDAELLFSPQLGQQIAQGFLALQPAYRFMLRAVELL